MAVMDKIRDIEVPDVSKMEMPDVSKLEMPKVDMPKVDIGKARESVSRATTSWRDAMSNRLPRRSAPSRLPYLVGGLLAGMSIGYFVATSSWFQKMVKNTVAQSRERLQQMRSQSADDGYTHLTAVMDETVVTDGGEPSLPNETAKRNEESYAI